MFLVLKLAGLIGWSWWWVTCPMWGPALPFLALIVFGLVVARREKDNGQPFPRW